MLKLVQISDLHFGAVDEKTLYPLLAAIDTIGPDIVLVTGDLTQRAKTIEFEAAREFLNKINRPKIVIPGNHDIPLYNIFKRFIKPLNKFLNYINDDELTEIKFQSAHIIGVNTARSLTFKNGRISKGQIELLNQSFCQNEPENINILAIHHNFISVESAAFTSLVGRSELLLEKMKDCRLDMIFTGHIHKPYSKVICNPHHPEMTTIIVSAGTATSYRRRNQPNSFNEAIIHGNEIKITVHEFKNEVFRPRTSISYERTVGKWLKT